MKYLLYTLSLSLFITITTIAQPLHHSYHNFAIDVSHTLFEGPDDQYLIGGGTGQFQGWPSFDAYLFSIDHAGLKQWEQTFNSISYSELGYITDIVYNETFDGYFVGTYESGCDYGTPQALHALNSSGEIVWSASVEEGIDKIVYLPDFGILVQAPYSKKLFQYDIYGSLIADFTLFSDPSISIRDMIKTGESKVALMDRNHIFMTDWSLSTNIVNATANLSDEAIAIDYLASDESVIVMTEEQLIELNADDLSEVGFKALSLWGTPIDLYCTSDHIYVLFLDNNLYTLVTFDNMLTYVEDWALGLSPYSSISDFIIKDEKLICLGDVRSREVPYLNFPAFYDNLGSDIFIRSWDLGLGSMSGMDVSLNALTVSDTTISIMEDMYCGVDPYVMNITYTGLQVKIINNGTEVLNDLVLNAGNFPCSFICPTTVTNTATFSDLDLQAGESTILNFGNHQTFFMPFEASYSFCVWASSPNGLLDVNPEDNSTCFTIDVGIYVAANEVASNPLRIQLYPNPTTDYIHLTSSESLSNEVKLSITNTLGNTLMTRDVQLLNNEYALSVDHLPSGVYLLIMESEGRTSSLRWVKK